MGMQIRSQHPAPFTQYVPLRAQGPHLVQVTHGPVKGVQELVLEDFGIRQVPAPAAEMQRAPVACVDNTQTRIDFAYRLIFQKRDIKRHMRWPRRSLGTFGPAPTCTHPGRRRRWTGRSCRRGGSQSTPGGRTRYLCSVQRQKRLSAYTLGHLSPLTMPARCVALQGSGRQTNSASADRRRETAQPITTTLFTGTGDRVDTCTTDCASTLTHNSHPAYP
jgi:hypothetical protein